MAKSEKLKLLCGSMSGNPNGDFCVEQKEVSDKRVADEHEEYYYSQILPMIVKQES